MTPQQRAQHEMAMHQHARVMEAQAEAAQAAAGYSGQQGHPGHPQHFPPAYQQQMHPGAPHQMQHQLAMQRQQQQQQHAQHQAQQTAHQNRLMHQQSLQMQAASASLYAGLGLADVDTAAMRDAAAQTGLQDRDVSLLPAQDRVRHFQTEVN
jgi:UDP-N-acetylglucosamine enolpyruvyl transferase